MKRIISIMAFMLLLAGTTQAAQTWKNETLKYALYIGPIKAGEACFVTRNTTFEGRKVVRMDLIARTTSAAEKIFSMNDTLTTYLDADNVRPVYFRKSCNEGGDIYTEWARFTYASDGTCAANMRKNYMDGRVKEKTQNSRTAVYDMMSVMGYARAMNTSGLTEGKHIDFKLVDAAEILDECLVYQGRETVKLSGKKYNCLVFKLVEPYWEKGKTKFKDILTIYVTDDSARKIVQMDIKFKVGSAKARIIE
ncbi:MAG: DUF3108 domain-containing protein [Bacteroidaceae bacterium]|nr:DUF3108 domain-containing protein [Bacteroidaceae bacterium]